MSAASTEDLVFSSWTQGRRENQEDNVGMAELGAGGQTGVPDLFVVADGMGGAAAGQVASDIAVGSFIDQARRSAAQTPGERLRGALTYANEQIASRVSGDSRLRGMGTTLIGAEIRDNLIRWISVGDSLLLLVQGEEIRRLNQDHSMAGLFAEMADRGEISKQEAKQRGGHNELRSALTGDPLKLIDETGLAGAQLRAGDVAILASDGLLTLDLQKIRKIAKAHAGSAQQIAQKLIAAVNEADRPQQDNATVLVYVQPGGPRARKDAGQTPVSPALIIGVAALVGVAALGALAYFFLAPPQA
jgi:serine/threonine protein phosphatase PrpC